MYLLLPIFKYGYLLIIFVRIYDIFIRITNFQEFFDIISKPINRKHLIDINCLRESNHWLQNESNNAGRHNFDDVRVNLNAICINLVRVIVFQFENENIALFAFRLQFVHYSVRFSICFESLYLYIFANDGTYYHVWELCLW